MAEIRGRFQRHWKRLALIVLVAGAAWFWVPPDTPYARNAIAVALALTALSDLLGLFDPVFQRLEPHAPRVEVSYATNRHSTSSSAFHQRIALVYLDPTPPTRLTDPIPPVRPNPAFVSGRRIAEAATHWVRIWNTGEAPLQGLEFGLQLRWPDGRGFRPDGERIDAASLSPTLFAGGPKVSLSLTDDQTIVGTCDLLNPWQRIDLEFETIVFGEWRTETAAQVLCRAKAPGLGPPVRCEWVHAMPPGLDDELVLPRPRPLPVDADWNFAHRRRPLLWLGANIQALGRLLTRLGKSVGWKKVRPL